jgi:hypothetical protein
MQSNDTRVLTASERLGPGCQPAPLPVIEPWSPIAEHLAVDPVLFLKIGDYILLLTIDPARQG